LIGEYALHVWLGLSVEKQSVVGENLSGVRCFVGFLSNSAIKSATYKKN
jgi:hypothetical protein